MRFWNEYIRIYTGPIALLYFGMFGVLSLKSYADTSLGFPLINNIQFNLLFPLIPTIPFFIITCLLLHKYNIEDEKQNYTEVSH